MLEYYMSLPNEETNDFVEGIRLLAVNVLSSAVYGHKRGWTAQDYWSKATTKETSFFGTLHVLINNFTWAALLPLNVLLFPGMPSTFRKMGEALKQFPSQMDGILNEERRLQQWSDATRHGVLHALVKH